MTDAAISQVAFIAPTIGEGDDAQISQLVFIAPCIDTSEQAHISQVAFICVDVEYFIPKVFVPMGVGQFLQSMPYWIMPFPSE